MPVSCVVSGPYWQRLSARHYLLQLRLSARHYLLQLRSGVMLLQLALYAMPRMHGAFCLRSNL